MFARISSLPNYCNGKLYKRWDRVSNIFGEDTLLAVKTNKKGETIELLISGDGKRELYTDTYKVMDITGDDNIRRTYSYQRSDKGIEGKMAVENVSDKQNQPLITSANWLMKNLIPQEVNLTLNTKHPKSKMFILGDKSQEGFKFIRPVTVKSIKASGFSDNLKPVPSKLEFTLNDGSIAKSGNPETGNIFASKFRGIKPETHPLEYINVVV